MTTELADNQIVAERRRGIGRSGRATAGVLLAAAAVLAGCQQGAQSDEGATGGSVSAAAAQSGGSPTDTQSDAADALTHFGNLALSFDPDPMVERNQATWALPVDPYYGEAAGDLSNLALDLVRTDCLHQAGFPEERLRTDYRAPKSPTAGNLWARQLFTVELAQRYGYRMAPDPSDTMAPEIAAKGGDWFSDKSDEYMNAWETCQDQAMEKVSGWQDAVRNAEDQAAWDRLHPGQPYPSTDAEFQAWLDEQLELGTAGLSADPENFVDINRWTVDTSGPELQAAAAQWRACMAPLGIPDLPGEPWDPGMRPPESLTTRWGWDSPLDPASADEIAVATHDAQCRQDAGWFDLLYDASWTQASAFVEQNREALNAQDMAWNRQVAEHAIPIIQEYIRQGWAS